MMITYDMLHIYSKYNGDGDMWVRMGSVSKGLTSNEWHLIDSLIQDCIIIDGNKASSAFINNFNKKLAEHLDSDKAITLLKSIAKKSLNAND